MRGELELSGKEVSSKEAEGVEKVGSKSGNLKEVGRGWRNKKGEAVKRYAE